MFTFIGGLFHNFVFLVCAAIVMALIGVIMAIYAIHRYRNYRSDVRWKHILRGVIVVAAVVLGVKFALDAYNIHAETPPPEEPAETAEIDEDCFQAIDFDHELLVAHFDYVGHQLDMTSMLEAQTRSRAIEEAYGVTFSDAVSTPLRTLKEVQTFKKLPAGDEREAELQAMLRDVNKASIEGLVPGLAQLEWLASEEYFTKNNPQLIEFYNEIMQELLHGEGWPHYLTYAISWTEDNPVYDISDELWDKLAYTRLFFEAARLRGIEKLTSTTNWHLPEGQKGSTVHCVRQTDPDDQDSMYWFLYDFSHKSKLADDGGSAPKYLVGDNTADKRFGTFEITAKEEPGQPAKEAKTPKDQDKDKDKDKDKDIVPQDPVDPTTPDPQPEYHRVIERFVDQDGKTIASEYTQPTPTLEGNNWRAEYEDLTKQGYELVETTTNTGLSWTGRDARKVSAKMGKQDVVVTFHYQQNKEYRVLIKYMNAKTQEEFRDLRVDEDYADGEEYHYESHTAAEMKRLGYGYFSEPSIKVVSGTIKGKDVEATVWYTPLEEATVKIHCYTDDGEWLGTYPETGKIGTTKDYPAPSFRNWKPHTSSIEIKFEPGNEYTIWYYRDKLPDGQGGKDPSAGPTASGDANKGGGDRQHDNNNLEEQGSDPGHKSDTVVSTDGGITENRVDNKGDSGAGSESTTNHDSTGTGASTNPIIRDPNGGNANNGTAPGANKGLSDLPPSSVAVTESQNNGSGGSTTVTTITSSNDGNKINGVVGDIG